jgi:hypothetical protein
VMMGDAVTLICNIFRLFCALPHLRVARDASRALGRELRRGFGRCGHIIRLTMLLSRSGKVNSGTEYFR